VAADLFSQGLRALGRTQGAAAGALALSQQYSYVFPEPGALALLATLGPIIEIGAGTGYWAAKLKSMGVDIVAFDQAPPDTDLVNRYHAKTATWTEVAPGDLTLLPAYPDRALFLCWPPLFSALGECLSFYPGDTVAYIGDDGHRTAPIAGLNEAFTKVAACPVRAVDPFPGTDPALTVWQRRR
jgi:hypothetical protein